MKVLKTKEIIPNRGKDNGKDGFFYYPLPNDYGVHNINGEVVFNGTKEECITFCLDQYE